MRRLRDLLVRDRHAPRRAWNPEEEREQGRRVAAEALAAYPGTVDAPLRTYVAQVGAGLAAGTAARGSDRYAWTFLVLEAPHVAVSAGPGGFVLVTRGALAACQEEDEVAALLAHGMAAVLGRHGQRWLDAIDPLVPPLRTQAAVAASGPFAPDAPPPGEAPPADPLAPYVEAARQDRGTRLDRELVLEADREAAHLLAFAGYDAQALRTWLLCRPRVVGAPTNLERAEALEPVLADLAARGYLPADAASRAARTARFLSLPVPGREALPLTPR